MYNWEFETNEKKKTTPKVVPVKTNQDDTGPTPTNGGNDDSSVEVDLNTIYFYSSVIFKNTHT